MSEAESVLLKKAAQNQTELSAARKLIQQLITSGTMDEPKLKELERLQQLEDKLLRNP